MKIEIERVWHDTEEGQEEFGKVWTISIMGDHVSETAGMIFHGKDDLGFDVYGLELDADAIQYAGLYMKDYQVEHESLKDASWEARKAITKTPHQEELF